MHQIELAGNSKTNQMLKFHFKSNLDFLFKVNHSHPEIEQSIQPWHLTRPSLEPFNRHFPLGALRFAVISSLAIGTFHVGGRIISTAIHSATIREEEREQ